MLLLSDTMKPYHMLDIGCARGFWGLNSASVVHSAVIAST
jgi:hypothetical protein